MVSLSAMVYGYTVVINLALDVQIIASFLGAKTLECTYSGFALRETLLVRASSPNLRML